MLAPNAHRRGEPAETQAREQCVRRVCGIVATGHARNAHGVALIGIAKGLAGHARIGVDIERLDREVGVDRLARKYLTAIERASLANLDLRQRRERFVRYWTCKEAMSKATADGLIAPFGRLDVELSDTPRLVDGPAPYVPSQWTLHRVGVPAAWAATIAIWRRG